MGTLPIDPGKSTVLFPKDAQRIGSVRDYYDLVSELGLRFRNALRNRRKSSDPSDVTENYNSSWGKVLRQEKWLGHESLSEFLNPRGDQQIISTLDSQWMIVPRRSYLDFRLDHLKSTLMSFVKPFSDPVTVAELGCGWGRNIFGLKSVDFPFPLRGFELTPEGVEAAHRIARHFNVPDVRFDQANLLEDDIEIADDVVYTYHCLEQIKYGTEDVLRRILACGPRRVVHFEPVVELLNPYKPRDFVNLAYNRVVRYQNSLLSSLEKLEAEGAVRILHVSREGFYQLPIQETCCVVWEPA